MKKEKISKTYRKPQLSLICPTNYWQKVSPSIVLTQPLLQFHQKSDSFTQAMKEFQNNKKIQVTTCTGWNPSFIRTDNFRSQSLKQQKQKTSQTFFHRRKSIQHRKLVIKNSPYVKSQKQYQKLLSVLKPVKGPTESLIKQIKKHNQVNRKNAQNVLLATKDSFKQKIMKFSSRMGIKNNEKIFVMNSKDHHIRQALQRNGWVQTMDLSTSFFHLKWVYTDSPNDYNHLQQGQFYNHFKHNQQLTNKNLLRKNIYKNNAYNRPNFPATFDLQAGQDNTLFSSEYLKYQSFRVLQQLVKFIQQNCSQYQTKIIKHNILGYGKSSKCKISISKHKQKQLIQILQPNIFNNPTNSEIKKIRQLLYQFCFIMAENCHKHVKKIKLNFQSSMSNMKAIRREGSGLLEHMQIQRAFHKFMKYISQDIGQNQKQFLLKIFNQDRFILIYILLLHKQLKLSYGDSFGTQNWWIIKPAGVSRGTGIKIQTDINKIMSNKYGKIVQKYIQRPLLLKCSRKFDIRQWVLVTSFVPLQAYIFEKCYCRFSSVKYNCSNSENLLIHLTNYSKQKQIFKKSGKNYDSIMSEQQLQLQINRSTWQGKWKCIKFQMYQQITKTLKCCQYEIQDRNECFQVFGFDVILDSEYKPWVLEVNMSPACQRRSQFIIHYLQRMADGLIDMFEGRQIRYWNKLSVQETQNQKHSNNDGKNRLTAEQAAFVIQNNYKEYKHKEKPNKQQNINT